MIYYISIWSTSLNVEYEQLTFQNRKMEKLDKLQKYA